MTNDTKPETTKHANLCGQLVRAQKLAAELGSIPKSSKVDFEYEKKGKKGQTKYKAARSEDVASLVQRVLAEVGLWTKVQSSIDQPAGCPPSILLEFTVGNADGETMTTKRYVPYDGGGLKKFHGNETVAIKYHWVRQLNIPCVDDDTDEVGESSRQGDRRSSTRPTTKQGAGEERQPKPKERGVAGDRTQAPSPAPATPPGETTAKPPPTTDGPSPLRAKVTRVVQRAKAKLKDAPYGYDSEETFQAIQSFFGDKNTTRLFYRDSEAKPKMQTDAVTADDLAAFAKRAKAFFDDVKPNREPGAQDELPPVGAAT